ncbi:hypothetical protein BUALT_Bualt02G0077000 [Buddleja alternifolia]|uniref:Small ribosomal subunit protein mS35 mitochondrial conserved domain-containing protein n=1 Tax=Buddleja alternifolia TaxID=168488 RepID=A0AAV6Y9F6_9LAMI|nr:hypothetical protein BUALT_Bualt02G0077000 [Buddleja alternifolia]
MTMRGGTLLRNISLYYTRNLHLSHNLLTTTSTTKSSSFISRASTIRFFSSSSDQNDLDSKPTLTQPQHNSPPHLQQDVNNKELKLQIEDYLNNFNEEALPSVFESVLKRRLSATHQDTDDELIDELQHKPLDNVKDEDFESDFEEANETDEEIDDLYNARDYVDHSCFLICHFNMKESKGRREIKKMRRHVCHGTCKIMSSISTIITTFNSVNGYFSDEIKKKVEKKFEEIGDRVEKGELEVEEGYALFKEFEDQMVLECAKLMEAEGSPQFDENDVPGDKKELDDPPGEGPILRWQTRVVFAPGSDAWHPKNRKVKLAVTVKELGLSKHQFLRLKELAGKRYSPGKDELTITSERFEHREENRKDCLRTLFALIEEAGKARKLVEEARTSDVKERLKANPKFMQRLQAKKMQVAESK